MDSVKENIKISKIAKKSLKVAIPKVEIVVPEIVVPEIPVPEIVVPEIPTIEGKKKKTMAESTLQALAKGREKLQATWAEKRKTKEDLKEQALQKKIDLQLKQKKMINEEYGLPNDDSQAESESEEEQIILPVKIKAKKAKSEPKAKPEPKLKKKVIRYVEESESEEEEIVYVKKNKKTPTKVIEQNIPKITFW